MWVGGKVEGKGKAAANPDEQDRRRSPDRREELHYAGELIIKK